LGNANLIRGIQGIGGLSPSPSPSPSPKPSALSPRILTPSSPSLFVFDLDGTLVDSRRDIADAANALLVSCGAAPIPEEQIGAMVGDGAATLVARAFKARGVDLPADALERYLACYDTLLLDHTRPYEGIPAVLEALGRRAKLAVLTNKPIAPTRRILEGLGLARYFSPEAILGGDGPFPRKPDPAALRHLIASAAVTPSTSVMVGDSIIDWRTARAAGTRACLAGYGFGFGSVSMQELTSDDRVVGTPSELLAL
jgi:phosphoglycolate phosphatase